MHTLPRPVPLPVVSHVCAHFPSLSLLLQVVKPPPSGVGPGSIVHATWTLDLVGATGICLFICAFITSAVFQLHPKKTLWILWTSFRRMALSMFTICTVSITTFTRSATYPVFRFRIVRLSIIMKT